MAAGLVQGEAIMRGLSDQTGEDGEAAAEEVASEEPEQEAASEGGAEEASSEGESSEAPEESEGAEGEDERKREEMAAKSDRNEDLAKSITEAVLAATKPLKDEIELLKSQPAAPKAPAKGIIVGLSKAEDGSGAPAIEMEAARIAKLTPEQQAIELTKMVHRQAAG